MYEKCADEGIKGISLGSDVTKWANESVEFSARSASEGRAEGSDKKMMKKKRVRVERRLSTSNRQGNRSRLPPSSSA